MENDSCHDFAERERDRLRHMEWRLKSESDEAGNTRDGITDEKESAQQLPSVIEEEDDNDSILSWGKVSDDADTACAVKPLPVRPLGLSRRAGYTQFDDFDVVTVHGACDDHQTAWTAVDDKSDWILDQLFVGRRARQLDYVYDTSDSARIHNSSTNGITTEANALLDSLTKDRSELPSTESDRPIVWICHDLGGSIVKQALINAMHRQPSPDYDDDPEYVTELCKMYRRLPLLTSTIIFLGCPHGSDSKQELEDQLFTLMCLPATPQLKSQILPKISNLARQVERINMEFLETNILDRAVILNITAGPENPAVTDAANKAQTEQNSELKSEDMEQTADPPTTADGLFSVYSGGIFHNLGIFYMLCARSTDHLGLVRGPRLDSSDINCNWARDLAWNFFNMELGYNINNHYTLLDYQNSLLSLSPPTRVNEYRFYTDGLSRPALMSWIVEHDVFDRAFHLRQGSKTVYLHAGHRDQIIDMKSVSRQLYVAYDIAKKDMHTRAPHTGCFYFEFDRLDSRRRGIRAMIISFVCTYTCRFWNDGNDEAGFSPAYLRKVKSWSLKDLITVFLRVQKTNGMRDMTIILGQIDQCDEEERSIFLRALLKRQKWSDLPFNLLITTTSPEDMICEILLPDRIISLDEYSPSLDEYIAYPNKSGNTDYRMQHLLVQRPEFTHISKQVKQIFEKFRNVTNLQDTVLKWLGCHKSGASAAEAPAIIGDILSDAHQKLLRYLLDRLTMGEQRIMTHVYRWIKHAAEPLTMEILVEAIRFSLPQEMAQLQHDLDHDEFGRFLGRAMAGIILLEGRDVRFSDDAFYEVAETGESNGKADQACRSHADMATVCLRYLLGREGQTMLRSLSVESHGLDDHDLSWSPIMIPRHSLVSYALRFWTVHYQAAGDYRPIDLATEVLVDKRKRRAWVEAVYVTSNPFTRIQKDYMSALPYMAMFGLDDLVRRQIQSDKRPGGWSQDQWLAIVEAARNGHERTVALLLEHSETDIAGLGEALHWAANYGESGALDLLVSKARGTKGFRWPPYILNRAMAAGLETLVSALVHVGYDLDEEDSDGKGRAVHTAVEYGQDRVLKILLNSGRVDLTLKNNDGKSALGLAAEVGNPESIRHLLSASNGSKEVVGQLLLTAIIYGNNEALRMLIDAYIHANSDIVNKIYDDGEVVVPVAEAAKRGFKECTRVLLDRGADPNAVGRDGSALDLAIGQEPFLDICLMLLEEGANPNQFAPQDRAYKEKNMVLMQAIETGSKSLVEMLLDHGAKINVADPSRTEYDTPLTWAIKSGTSDIVSLLLERGADPNLVSEDKPGCWSPLFTACYCKLDVSLTESLIKRGANIRWTRKSDGWSVLHAAYDSHKTLSMLLANDVDINATDNVNFTTLMVAAMNNEMLSVEVLLNQVSPKADLETESAEEDESTALNLACECRSADAMKLLVEAGANINHQNAYGFFPLGQLLACKDFKAPGLCEKPVEFMLDRGPDLSLTDHRDNTVLHKIEKWTPLSVVMRLIEDGAPVGKRNDTGVNDLVSIIHKGNIDAIRYLARIKGARFDLSEPRNGSILHVACRDSTLELVKLLVRAGADPNIVENELGGSLLYAAMENQDRKESRKIIRYLVEDVGVEINPPDSDGGQAWLLVFVRGSPLLFAVRITRENFLLRYLLNHGARRDAVGVFGRTVCHALVSRYEFKSLRKFTKDADTLVRNWADFSAGDDQGLTPIHLAAMSGSLETTRQILEKLFAVCDELDINVADMDGWTPLMWACRRKDPSIAHFLVEKFKADVNMRSKDSVWSPLKIARFHGWTEASTEKLIPGFGYPGRENSRVSKDNQTMPGKDCTVLDDCWACNMKCYGEIWKCTSCLFFLCFKCFPHREILHEHNDFMDFTDLLPVGDWSDDEGDSRNGNENEEQDEDGTESEEDEEDDSE